MELEIDSGTSLFPARVQSLLRDRETDTKERQTMRDARMQNSADAKAYGMVTSKTVRVSERWQGSGTKSGECVSIFPDGTRIPFTRTRKPNENAKRITRASQAAQKRQLIQSITLDHNFNEG